MENKGMIQRRGFLKKVLGFAAAGSIISGTAEAAAWQSAESASLPVAAANSAGTEPFLGEIAMVSFNFAPKGWALCNGQLLPINQYQALFALLGTTYGGDGRVNFALPDLRGRTPLHVGNGHTLGERAGSASHILSTGQLPTHVHSFGSSDYGTSVSPVNNVPARHNISSPVYEGGTAAMNAQNMRNVGGGQPHENMPPYLVLNFIIALQGIFPSSS